MVGSPQDIQCIVSTVSGVELSSVMISWMGPGGESITNDSRVTISPTTSSGNNYTSSLQFTYLMEGDEGVYTCSVMILGTNVSNFIDIKTLTIPAPNIEIIALNNQTVGQSLTLESAITTVRGVTSRVDIVWSSNGVELKRINNTNTSLTVNDSELYEDTFSIQLLSTNDDGRTVQCEVIINTIPSTIATIKKITLNVTVPTPTITALPSDTIQGAMVGSPQDIQCIVSTVDGVELSPVMISWMGPRGESIANDSRVTISSTTSSGSNYTSSLQFTYLMEGDGGMYACSVMILKANASRIIDVQTLTIPAPSIEIIALNNQTVSQSLTLESTITTVRGITSRVDIVWSSNGVELKRINNANISLTVNNSELYKDTFNVRPLSTSDDSRVFQCEVSIMATPSVIATIKKITLNVTVPIPTITALPSSSIQGAMVGSAQDIQCIVSTVSGVELNSVMISWMGPGGESITNDSRVTISPTTSSGNNYTSSLQFTYLMEGDEGLYTCNVSILETSISKVVELNDIIVPNSTNVTVTASNTQIVGQSLILECSVTIVRGITSRVDIEWNIGNMIIQRTEGISVISIISDNVIYKNSYNISQVSTLDDGRDYQCKVIINTIPQLMATDSTTLDVTVPNPILILSPSKTIQRALIGSPQSIECTVRAVNGVDLSSVMISWMGPDGNLVANSSRIIVNPVTSLNNNYTSSLHFIYLMEGDVGIYTCNVTILETVQSSAVELGRLTLSNSTNVMVTTLNEQIVGQPLMLECTMSTPRGINSRVDIVWTRDGVEVERVNDVSSNFSSPEVVVYTNIYTIPLLGTYDDDVVYECEVIINSSPLHKITKDLTIDVTVPLPTVTVLPSDPIQGAMVGSAVVIVCTVSTVDGVEPSSVSISWLGPKGSYANNSRITIEMDAMEVQLGEHHNVYNSTLQFSYLMEGDEGIYRCSVRILDTVNLHAIEIKSLTIPKPLIQTNIPSNQTVGQSLTIECTITSVRGVNSRVDIVWSSNGSELAILKGLNYTFATNDSVIYSEVYIIPQLSTLDDGRTLMCDVIINAISRVMAIGSVTLNVTVPFIKIATLPSDPIQRAIVGSPQDIQCIVSTVSGVELSSVMISWRGPGGEAITNDSRVTISPTTSSDNNYTSSLQFTYLIEGDEGVYTCNVTILGNTISTFTLVNNLIVPIPEIFITAPVAQTVGQSLVLSCHVIAVRGITSKVEMVWSSNNSDLEAIEANISSITNDSVEYTAYYTIVQLNETDDGRVYYCKVVIDSSPQVTANNNITLNAIVPFPSVILKASNTQTVGQPLSLECIMTTVRGVISKIDIIWSSNGVEIKKISGAAISSSTNSSILYKDFYNISLLTTADEGKVYQCEGVINATPRLTVKSSLLLDVTVPNPIIVILPYNHTFEAMVGSPQDIKCIVSTVSGVELSSVMISWMGPGGESITNDSRVTISPITSSGSNYTSSLQFTYLMEGDEGVYTCNVMILETNGTDTRNVILHVSSPVVKVDAPSIQMVSESLTFKCIVTTVRGITSRADIVWSSNNVSLKIVEGIESNLTKNGSVIYMDSYTIPQLGTVDEGRTYRCGIIINQLLPITVNDSITLDVIVPKISIDISQSVEGSVIGLPHTLICTAIVVIGVSPSLVRVNWTGSTSLLDSPRVAIFNQTSTKSQYSLKFESTVTFFPLLNHDIGNYICSVMVTGFDRVGSSDSAEVIANSPTLIVKLSPPLIVGDSGEDAVELLCTALVAEDVLSATYQFTWIKDDTLVDLSNNRIMLTDNNGTSSFVIKATDSNATLDNGIYTCQVTLTIFESYNLSKISNDSAVLFEAMIPPIEFTSIKVITAPYSVEISWITPYIILDNETYSVQYSTDVSLQNSSEVMIVATNRYTINETFSINITKLIPFTEYYYIIQASNLAGSTYTDIMNFTTNQTAPSAAPSNFQAVNITSTSITFSWDSLVDGANGIIQFYIINCTSDDNNIIMLNVTYANTMETLDNLKPFTNYTCTLHAVTISDGPPSYPVMVITAEQVPTAPVVDIIAIDSRSVLIEWDIPMDTNGALTIYTIYYTIENGPEQSITVPFNGQDIQSYNITGINPYQQIRVSITAANGGGTSVPSNEVSGRTNEAAPGIVEVVDVVTISDSVSVVTWIEPIQPNGIIIGYEVMYSVYEDAISIITAPVTSSMNSYNITNLYAGIPYQVKVVAFTSAGRGIESYSYTFFTQELSPEKPPENVKYERSNTTISISWDPVNLFEAKGFPTYLVTLTPLSSSSSRTTRSSSGDGIISVTTNETDVLIEDLDPNVEYSLTVAVETSAGKVTTKTIKVTATNEQLSSERKEGDSSEVLISLLTIFSVVCIIIIIIIVIICLVKRQRRNNKSFEVSNDIYDTVEMQSSIHNATLHENCSTEKDEAKLSKTTLSDHGINDTGNSQPHEQDACINENPSVSNEAIYNVHLRATENPYSFDVSTEGTPTPCTADHVE